MTKVTYKRAKELFALDPETGWLTWKVYKSSRSAIGSRAGYVSTKDGYRRLQIDGVMYLEHLVIWLLVHGEFPTRQVDHENRTRDDNRPSNLRLATVSQNRANAKIRSDNTTGHRGVSPHKQTGKFNASYTLNGRKKSLGLYFTAAEAGDVARRKRLDVFGPFAPSYDHIEGA